MNTFPVVRFVFGGVESDRGSEARPYTLVYDGQCRVCGRLVRLLDRWDAKNRIEAVPSQNTSVNVRFPWIPPEAYAESVQLVGPGGKTWQGAAAIEELLGVLPRGRIVGWVFAIPYVDRVADRLYRWFAKNRYRFGCGEHCQYRPLHLRHGDEFPEEPEAGGPPLPAAD